MPGHDTIGTQYIIFEYTLLPVVLSDHSITSMVRLGWVGLAGVGSECAYNYTYNISRDPRK